MTYLERITYLTGNLVQSTQFALKNACRFVSLLSINNEDLPFRKTGEADFVIAEKNATQLLLSFKSLSLSEILSLLKEKGMSVKDLKSLEDVISTRDYVMTYFYVENGDALAMEDINVYNAKIKELQSYVDKANELNVRFVNACERLYH